MTIFQGDAFDLMLATIVNHWDNLWDYQYIKTRWQFWIEVNLYM